jgi:hypothetical protein
MNETEKFIQHFLEFTCLRLLFESIKWALNLDLAECKNLFRNRHCSLKQTKVSEEKQAVDLNVNMKLMET